MDKRAILLEKIKKEGFPKNEVFVSLKDFFDGNDDSGSIGVNIFPEPVALSEFYKILTEIESAEKTEKILVRIADIDDVDWFFSDAVYIFGNYTLEEVKQLFEPLKPDEVNQGLMYGKPSNLSDINNGAAYSIWWD